MCVHVCVRVHVCVHVCMRVCVHACVCVCVCGTFKNSNLVSSAITIFLPCPANTSRQLSNDRGKMCTPLLTACHTPC